jgi:hypothetical protein
LMCACGCAREGGSADALQLQKSVLCTENQIGDDDTHKTRA